MTLLRRLQALERASPDEDNRVVVIWHTIVSRDGDTLHERPGGAWIALGPGGAGEQTWPEAGETPPAFEARVIAAARRIHGRADAAFCDALRWTPA